MRRKTIWLLLADGQRATAYRYLGADRIPEIEADFDIERMDAKPTRKIVSDKSGRMKSSALGRGGTALPGRVDPHEEAELRFLDDIAKKLDAAIKAKRCDVLILAAPPKALGHLRQVLSAGARKIIKAEIAKDLTKTVPAKLAKLVAQQLEE